MRTLKVQEPGQLLDYLFKTLKDTKKTRIRQSLKFGSISVNGKAITRFDHPLIPGDKVCILTAKEARPALAPQFGVEVVFEDDAIIVINKPSGLLTIATETEAMQTAFYATNEYVCESEAEKHKGDRHFGERAALKKRIFIVHRLDRDASGLLVFAKNAEIKGLLQSGWQNVTKKYYAVVEGIPKEKSGTIKSSLRENKFLKVYSDPKAQDAKPSITHYQVLQSGGHYSLVEVELETGRKHQISVHLSEMGHPIAGDERYGSKTDPAGRLALHAFYLSLPHPVSGELKVFQSALPGAFEQILRKDGFKG